MSRFSPVLVARLGARDLIKVGTLGLTASFVMLSRAGADSSYAGAVLAPMLLNGLAAGLVFMPVTAIALSDVEPEHAGSASGLLQTTQQLGSAVGVAVIVSVYAAGAVPGRKAKPDASGPKPSTPWTYWTTRKNIDSCPPTTSAITVSAATRRRLASRCDWIIGWATRRSVTASTASSTAPAANPPRVRAEVHPCSGIPIRAQTNETAPSVAVTAPTKSKRPGRRGVSVTKRRASTSRHFPQRENLLDAIMQSWVDKVEETADQALGHEGPPREVLLAWFETYVALISLHKGGPAKITSAMGHSDSPIATKCQTLTRANDRVVERLKQEGALREGVDSVQMVRLVGGVAAVADQGDLDATVVGPLLEVVADGLLR